MEMLSNFMSEISGVSKYMWAKSHGETCTHQSTIKDGWWLVGQENSFLLGYSSLAN
jgi:hypothetical protein